MKPNAAVFVLGASVNKDGVGNAEMPGKSPAQTVQETFMCKPSIERKAQRPPPGIANPAASYQDVLCSLLVQQSQCLQRQGMPDLKGEAFTGDRLRFQFIMTMFETAVEVKTQVPKERLAMLIEFTSGEPNRLIDLPLSRAISWISKSQGTFEKKGMATLYVWLIRIWTSFDRGLEYQMEMARQVESFLFSW